MAKVDLKKIGEWLQWAQGQVQQLGQKVAGLLQPKQAPQPATLPPQQQGVVWTPYGGMSIAPEKQKETTKTTTSKSEDLRTDVSIVDYLKSIGQPSDFASRKKLAEQYGIKDYRGTAQQNLQLLALLKSGQKPAAGEVTTTGGTPTGGVATTPPTETTVTDPLQQFLQRMNQIISAYEKTLQSTPPTTGLTPEERRIYEQTTEELKKRYEKALQDLERKHQQEQQRLIARYAAAGFSEPGILTGPMAGVPGVVTQALEEERERQARERAALEQAQAGDILAAQQALAEAERRAREEEYNRWLKEQQQKLENLLKQAGLYETIYEATTPQRTTIGGRIYEYDPSTKTWKDVTPEAAKKAETEKAWEWNVDAQGNVYRVNPLTGEFQVIGKVAPKPDDAQRIAQIGTFLESRRGKDGYVSAEDWLEARKQWIAMGGTIEDFEAAFPYWQWMGEWEWKKVLKPKTTTIGEELTPEEIERISKLIP
jgi:DNA replication initiation complex subunit (GINS family)